MLRVTGFIILLFSLAGCCNRYADFFPCHDDGRIKPAVALVRVSDKSSNDLRWNVGEELTVGLTKQAKIEGHLFLISRDTVDATFAQVGKKELMDEELEFFKRFQGSDFIVLMEVVDHSESPLRPSDEIPLYLQNAYVDRHEVARLEMKTLVKIIDIRGDTPRLFMQEVVNSLYMVPTGIKAVDYNRQRWGSREYELTPLKQAHAIIIRDVLQRLDRMTLAASS